MKPQSVLLLLLVSLGFASCTVDSSLKETSSNSSKELSPAPKASIIADIDESTSLQVPIIINFTEEVSDFIASDIIVSQGSISNFSGSGRTYTLNINLTTSESVTIQIPAGVATGSSGRKNLAVVYIIAGFAPTISTAMLSGLPTSPSNVIALDTEVSGEEVISYQYKIGPKASTDCSDSLGYSASVGVDEKIDADISGESDGELILCVIGASASVQQNYDVATQYVWVKDTQAPNILGLADDSTWAKSKVWSWSCNETCTFAYTVDTNSTTSPSGTFSSVQTVTQNSGTGRNYLHVKAKDVAGNESAIIHVYADLDNEAPNAPASLNDSSFSNATESSTPLSWTPSTDGAGSGVDHYQYAIGSIAGGSNVKGWTSVATASALATSLTLSHGATYFASVRAVDSAGNVSEVTEGDGWFVDSVPPEQVTSLLISNDGSLTQTPTVTWTAPTDSGSGISHYRFAVGTTSGGSDISSWASISNVLTFRRTGLSLDAGEDYYISVRAVDLAGNQGNVATGLWTAPVAASGCEAGDAEIGEICSGGAVYVGEYNGKMYMTTPGGCTNSSTPVCAGGSDNLFLSYGTYGINTGAVSTTDGFTNTVVLASYADANAAKFCSDLVFGGYTNWHLPALGELQNVILGNHAALSGIRYDIYYSSSTQNPTASFRAYNYQPGFYDSEFGYAGQGNSSKQSAGAVRCVRAYQ